ncbi:MAG: hypothetical protein AAGE61_08295 [Pseudomonadota bacterium]
MRAAHLFVALTAVTLVLSGCGRKPELRELEAPPPNRAEAEVAPALEGETIDGLEDGQQSVERSRPKRRIFLDYLL